MLSCGVVVMSSWRHRDDSKPSSCDVIVTSSRLASCRQAAVQGGRHREQPAVLHHRPVYADHLHGGAVQRRASRRLLRLVRRTQPHHHGADQAEAAAVLGLLEGKTPIVRRTRSYDAEPNSWNVGSCHHHVATFATPPLGSIWPWVLPNARFLHIIWPLVERNLNEIVTHRHR